MAFGAIGLFLGPVMPASPAHCSLPGSKGRKILWKILRKAKSLPAGRIPWCKRTKP